jgi:transcriptional regulator with XRE-family HTH domain
MKELAGYLAMLRKKRGLTLRDVEQHTGISNAYLSLLETGRKKYLPAPRILANLADCYGTTKEEMLAKAGYLNRPSVIESLEKRIDKAFRFACSDPRFIYGQRVRKRYDLDIKRFVVELYQKATGQIIADGVLMTVAAPGELPRDHLHKLEFPEGRKLKFDRGLNFPNTSKTEKSAPSSDDRPSASSLRKPRRKGL